METFQRQNHQTQNAESTQTQSNVRQPNHNGKPLLEVKELQTFFYTEDGVVRAINGVDFTIHPGEVMGLVGESGSG